MFMLIVAILALSSLVNEVKCYKILVSPRIMQQKWSHHAFCSVSSSRHSRHQSTLLLYSSKDKEKDEKGNKLQSSVIESSEAGSSLLQKLAIPLGLGLLAAAVFATGQRVDFTALLDQSVAKISELGPYGYAYFALVYIAAELLAIPAMPLTASSGYLFGLLPGTLLVIASASFAASVSFLIGRTFLRTWAQQFIQGSPKWRAIDKAIGREGFKVVLLLRLSPLLPFALSNYLYAVTSVDFWSFIAATFIGFTPGTFGIVYFGSAGKAFLSGDAGLNLPWYGYAAAGAVVLVIAQTIGKVANDALKSIEEEEALHNSQNSNPKDKI